MPNFDPRMSEIGRGVLLPLPPGVIEMVHRVGVCRVVSRTRYSWSRAPAAVVCTRTSNWIYPDMVRWFPYDFTMGDLYVVPP